MRKWSVGAILVLGTLFLGLLSPGATRASMPASVANLSGSAAQSTWVSTIIDSTGDRGSAPSMARQPFTGQLYISYYDATTHDLRLAYPASGSGNCGPNNLWHCETVDSLGDVGQYSSLAFDPVTGYPRIAYYDATNRALKYAEYWCPPSGCTWNLITIETAPTLSWAGLYPSLKIGLDSVPRIAYHRSSLMSGVLKYAQWVDGGGNCGPSASWQCDVIDSTDVTGLYPSLDLTTATNPFNVPYIAYYNSSSGDLRYTWYLGTGGGNCGPSNNWMCVTLDPGGFAADTGRYPVLRVIHGSSGVDHMGIVYYDATYDQINYIYPDPGSSCNEGLSGWRCDTITGTLSAELGTHIGLDLDVSSTYAPVVAYGCSACAGKGILLARYVGLLGNCGPLKELPFIGWTNTWRCDTVVSDPYTGHDYSQYADVDINTADLAALAFYDATVGDLRFTQQYVHVYLPLVLKP